MKATVATLLTFGAAVLAQDLASLPACGQTCIGNMLAIAQREFGCAPGDAVCYCTNVNFGYGVRDCSNAVCSAPDAATVISFGTAYCAQALAAGASSAAASASNVAASASDVAASASDVLSSAAGAASSASESAASVSASLSAAAESTPITTSPLVATITSDGSTILSTTGFQTIYAPITAVSSAVSSLESEASSAASSVASEASSVASDASSAVSSAASSASGAVSSALSSASSRLSSAVASATSTGGAAPMVTAAPLLGAAAIAALLL